jgi:hypothetical protein
MRWERSSQCAVLVATLACADRARAAAEESAVVSLRVVSSPAEAREMREALADLLSRLEIGIDDAPSAMRRSLVDVEIDLSTGRGGPFVALSTREPPAIVCRRFLSPQASREVLIESAAEVAYAAIESRARALGVLRAGEPAIAVPPSTPPFARPPPPAITVAGDPAALQTKATNDAALPGYGVDAAAFAEMQTRGFGSGLLTAGGGAAVTLGLRGIRLAPALVLGLSYLRSVGVEDPAGPGNFSMVSTRLGATVNALGFRWISLQVGPALAVEVVRGDVPVFMSGPGPVMMPMPGATNSFSGLGVWAGGTARLSIRVAERSHVFVAAGGDYQLRQAGPLRPAGGGGPPNGAVGAAPQGIDGASSGWRSSFVIGLTFTLAGRPLMTD